MYTIGQVRVIGELRLLIVPLHRHLGRANFPLVTALLILANCFVFFALQSGDERVAARAFDYYRRAGLERIEFPAFADWLRAHAGNAQALQAMQYAADALKLQMLQANADFLAALHADRVIDPAREDYADWREKRAAFDRIWSSAFTERYELRFSEIDPARLFGAMFLHGGIGHLLG
ncbi:MAG: hypothetical protein ACREPT_00710, partial [Rudaea sp.]